MKKIKRCEICWGVGCKSMHSTAERKLSDYVMYTDTGLVLTKGGERKFGSDYLNKLREQSCTQ